MRLRNIQGSREAIEKSRYVVKNPESYKDNWKELFGNNHPIHLEIGMGKGKFITQLAMENRDINFIGIEKYSSVLVRALEKMEDSDISNLYFIREDAVDITKIFGAEEVSKIYLNFSDPWPKDRHAKRRLTSKEFFERYNEILKMEGTIEFKTDNRSLFDFSLEQIPMADWKIKQHTYDLHHSPMNTGNVMTEYEEKFSMQGNHICKLIASR